MTRLLTCLLLLVTLLVTTGVPAAVDDGCGSDCTVTWHGGATAETACGDGACNGHGTGCSGHCMPAIQTQSTVRLPSLAAARSAIDLAGVLAHSPPERLLRPPIAA
jgi:hypothetical protein